MLFQGRIYEVFYDTNDGVVYHKQFKLRYRAHHFFHRCQRFAPQGCGEFAEIAPCGDTTILQSYEGGG